jgi:tripartite-type tricarboxylate transporter receptor subunit TctC
MPGASYPCARFLLTPPGDEMLRTLVKGVVAVATSAAILTSSAIAQEYPTREIRAICNFAVGGGGDILVRYFSDQLSKQLGRPVIVENRPGAQGNIATDLLAKSKPDGYTIMITPGSSTLAAAPYLSKTLPFDPIKDIQPVTTIAKLNFAFAVSANNPARNMAELREQLRKKPNHGSWGTSNNTGQVSGELFKEMSGLQSLFVNYKTTGQALTDLLGGQLDFMVFDATFLATQVKGGKIRLLAVTGATRTETLPDVPTMQEAGFKGYDISAWWGVVVPAGTPQPIVNRLESVFNQIVRSNETKEFLARVATDPLLGNQKMMAAMVQKDMERWKQWVKLAKIEPQ